MKILVTGGAGFIGSALIRWLIEQTDHSVINVDKLTYAGNLQSLESVAGSGRYQLEALDICEREGLRRLFTSSQPDAVVHLAAESHVDRSIDDPGVFIQTNLVGTFEILEASRAYWQSLAADRREHFRFLHVSTDEVYGDLAGTSDLFTENTRYAPSSPYSASKAGSDHLARSWHRTYGMPVLVTNCSNNYGPYQFPEKLIPHMVLNALGGQPLPIYGDGTQVRDWLYVDDHARALLAVLERGQVGETYNIGGHNEHQNIEIVRMICAELQSNDAVVAPEGVARYDSLITFVDDRPGHDLRYAIDAGKIAQELGWRPQETFATGLAKTIRWYLENQGWWGAVLDGSYQLERRGRVSA